MEANESFNKWVEAYKTLAAGGTDLMWPSETLVRVFKGSYVPGLDRDYTGKKVIDVGFGNGNNLVFLATLGLSLHGSEVDSEICDMVNGKLGSLGQTADLRIGTNRAIPFDDDEFDFLVSWNVLHYEDNEADMRAAIKEYARVLKPGGRFFISTTGPEHLILKDGKTLGGHRYQIGRDDDFRKGQVFFYFDAPNYVKFYLSESFDDVLVGRTHDFLFTDTLDWFIATGVKG